MDKNERGILTPDKQQSIFEELKGSVHIHDNILDPIDEKWEAGS